MNEFHANAQNIASECVNLLTSKHSDYGPDNINATGLAGIAVRLSDKAARLRHLVLENKAPRYESIEDTLKDHLAYALIGLMLQRGVWPRG